MSSGHACLWALYKLIAYVGGRCEHQTSNLLQYNKKNMQVHHTLANEKKAS